MINYYGKATAAIGNALNGIESELGKRNLMYWNNGIAGYTPGAWSGYNWARSIVDSEYGSGFMPVPCVCNHNSLGNKGISGSLGI